jgi:hypothetical protein
MSSIQSVPGQPESPPDSTPMHHSLASPVAAARACVFRSSHVAGGSPVQFFVLYQMSPFTAPLVKMPTSLPSSALPRAANPAGVELS